MATLELQGLSTAGADAVSLDEVTCTVEGGRIAALFGPVGAGKTALLRAICGLERVSAGEVLLDDERVTSRPPHRRGIGLVFPDLALFEGRTVRDNVAYGLRAIGYPRGERLRRVSEMLELVGAPGLEQRPIDRLTPDQRQRVAIARALAPGPRVLLLDTPLAQISPADRPAFRDRLREVLRALGMTAVVATSDLDDAFALADDLLVLDGGRLLQSGPLWRVLHGPRSVRTAELFGYATLISGATGDGRIWEAGAGTLEYPPAFPLGDRALALAHPSALLGVPVDSGLGCGIEGEIERVRAYGPTWVLDLRVGNRTLEVRWEWDMVPPLRGERIAVNVRPDTLRFFDDPGEADTPVEVRPRLALPSAPVETAASPPDVTPSAEAVSVDSGHRGMPLD